MTYNKETKQFIRGAMERITLEDKLQSAILDMMAKVKIDDKHNYTRISDGKWLAGVSSVSGLVPKDWLSAWGAKESVKALGFSDFEGDTKFAEEVLAKIKKCKSVEEYIAILKDAKGASARKSKEALLDGTVGHEWIENYIKACIRFEEPPKYPEGKLERALKQFVEWAESNVDYWLLSEARVCDVEREYAGTLDAVAKMKDGSLALVDLKFASHISPEYKLQTSAYVATFENYGIRFDKRIIVRLPKTLKREEWDKKERKYKKIENIIEVIIWDDYKKYEWERDVFYSALPVKKWVNYELENND